MRVCKAGPGAEFSQATLSFRVPSSPSLRLATLQDAPAIAALHAASWRATYAGIFSQNFLDHHADKNRLDLWQKRLGDPAANQWVQLAHVEDKLAGFICVFAAEDDKFGSLIDNLHVAPGMTGHRIGRRLMASASQWLAQGYADDPVYLWVLERNTGAKRFYEAVGGRDDGLHEHAHADGQVLPACRMVWPFPGAISA